jgi:CRISPR system Cascade subunit CasE
MNLYLSKLSLNHRSRQAQSELRDPYELHRTLSKAFAGDHAQDAEGRCLFRVDEAIEGKSIPVLVQSSTKPDWSYLDALPGYLWDPPLTKAFAPQFAVGRQLAFRLRANPTVKQGGKRLGLYKDEECLNWLTRKAVESGFSIVQVTATPAEKLICRHDEGMAVLSSVRFDGTLTGDDPERLAESVRNGIGASKGFGFGLLSLAGGA